MPFQTIQIDRDNSVVTITLNRPERLNAINMTMMRELSTLLPELELDKGVRVLVVTGAGRAFTAGADFKEASEIIGLVEGSPYTFVEFYLTVVRKVMAGLQSSRLPVIAMMNGLAHGVGLDLALACDIRIGCEHTRTNVGYPRRGIIPAGGGTWFLPRLVGLGRAAELILTTRDIEPEEAERIGLINKLVPSESLLEATMTMAQGMARGAPIALHLSKLNLYRGLGLDLATAMEMLSPYQTVCFQTDDQREATLAFQQKRQPQFRGT